MALCDCCNLDIRVAPTTSRRKRASGVFTMWPNQQGHVPDTCSPKKARVLTRRVESTPCWNIQPEKDIRPDHVPGFDYDHFQHFLMATTMAAATVAYHHRVNESSSYYQVLPDMRVVKYFFDYQETIRLAYAVPVWRSTIVGEYVYFPSEGKWIFVNASSIDDGCEMVEDSVMNRSCGAIREIQATPGSSHSMPPPQTKRTVPKVRYCAHRSHTPSSNFAEVVHREPVRENWHILVTKLLALQQEIDSKSQERRR